MALTTFQPPPKGSAGEPAKPWRDIYSVSRLNREVRGLLEAGFPPLWIEAEISNLARPASGHLYFSLKDKKSQARCAMFRSSSYNLRFEPANGQQVLVQARVNLYEPRGEFQLVVEHMEPAGTGALQRAFEQLKAKLEAEGLFAAADKKLLPDIPRCIGVITSPTGAAIRDILSVLKRRFPAIPVILYPVPVQGEGAAQKIANAIISADARRDCDLLIVARGGGSLEDLWAFNEEVVARAVHACGLPVISGVGHEPDTTITDFCADLRSATPSAAAEAAVPDREQWLSQFAIAERSMAATIDRQLRTLQQQNDQLALRLERQHPRRQLGALAQQLNALRQRASVATRRRLALEQQHYHNLHRRLALHHPATAIGQTRSQLVGLEQRLQRAQQQRLENISARLTALPPRLLRSWQLQQREATAKLVSCSHQLNALSPLATVARGYGIARHNRASY